MSEPYCDVCAYCGAPDVMSPTVELPMSWTMRGGVHVPSAGLHTSVSVRSNYGARRIDR